MTRGCSIHHVPTFGYRLAGLTLVSTAITYGVLHTHGSTAAVWA